MISRARTAIPLRLRMTSKRLLSLKAETEDIKLKEDQVAVTRTRDGLGISVKYRIHVDMVVHPVDLDFTANSLNKRI